MADTPAQKNPCGAMLGLCTGCLPTAGAAALYAAQSPNPTNQVFLEELLSNGEMSYPGQGGSHPEPFLNISHLLP